MTREPTAVLDRELLDLPPELRMREWMMRVEAAIFASPRPVPGSVLSQLIGITVPLEDVLAAIQEELAARPFELVCVAGGWQHRTRERYGALLRQTLADLAERSTDLTLREMQLLVTIAIRQPVTRRQCEEVLGRAVSGDEIACLRAAGLIAHGHRQPGPGAPFTLVTTGLFLEIFGFASLADLHDAMTIPSDQHP